MFLFIFARDGVWYTCYGIQIHLMFLFIAEIHSLLWAYADIQIHLMFLFIEAVNLGSDIAEDSNTSHVLIYPFRTYTKFVSKQFKYISCSYLSSIYA